MAMFESKLSEQLETELMKQEYKLEDGSMVTNIEGICQGLIDRALDGDLSVIHLISELLTGKK